MCGFCVERGDIYEEKNLPKFSKSVERFKSYNFFPTMYKKKVQEWSGCMLTRTWLHGDEDMIVRDQSNNYFHLTPKIGPLCPPPMEFSYLRETHKCHICSITGVEEEIKKSIWRPIVLQGAWVKTDNTKTTITELWCWLQCLQREHTHKKLLKFGHCPN